MAASFRKLERELGNSDHMVFILRHQDAEVARRASDKLVSRLRSDPDIVSAANRLDLGYYRRNVLYLAEEEDLGKLREGLRLLGAVDPVSALKMLEEELRGLDEKAARRMGYGYDPDSYMVSPQGECVLVLARPAKSATDYDFTLPFARRMEGYARSLQDRYPGLEALPGGNHFFA